MQRSERRPSELLLGDLEAIGRLAGKLGVDSDATDFDVLAELMPGLRVHRA